MVKVTKWSKLKYCTLFVLCYHTEFYRLIMEACDLLLLLRDLEVFRKPHNSYLKLKRVPQDLVTVMQHVLTAPRHLLTASEHLHHVYNCSVTLTNWFGVLTIPASKYLLTAPECFHNYYVVLNICYRRLASSYAALTNGSGTLTNH